MTHLRAGRRPPLLRQRSFVLPWAQRLLLEQFGERQRLPQAPDLRQWGRPHEQLRPPAPVRVFRPLHLRMIRLFVHLTICSVAFCPERLFWAECKQKMAAERAFFW